METPGELALELMTTFVRKCRDIGDLSEACKWLYEEAERMLREFGKREASAEREACVELLREQARVIRAANPGRGKGKASHVGEFTAGAVERCADLVKSRKGK